MPGSPGLAKIVLEKKAVELTVAFIPIDADKTAMQSRRCMFRVLYNAQADPIDPYNCTPVALDPNVFKEEAMDNIRAFAGNDGVVAVTISEAVSSGSFNKACHPIPNGKFFVFDPASRFTSFTVTQNGRVKSVGGPIPPGEKHLLEYQWNDVRGTFSYAVDGKRMKPIAPTGAEKCRTM